MSFRYQTGERPMTAAGGGKPARPAMMPAWVLPALSKSERQGTRGLAQLRDWQALGEVAVRVAVGELGPVV
jgi:hypothetical protein